MVATMGPVTCSMLSMAASRALRPFSSMRRCTFSTTTMASSTTRPMARTRAKREMVLALIPAAKRTAKVPMIETGTAALGIRVALQFCKKR